MKNRRAVLLSLGLFVLTVQYSWGQGHSYIEIDGDRIEFQLPDGSKELEKDFLDVVKQINNTVVYAALLEVGGSNGIFFISRYPVDHPMPVQEAFETAAEIKAALPGFGDDYILTETKTYRLEGKTLRLKIAEHTDKIKTVMFYFMKNDFADALYEIKLAGSEQEISKTKDLLEKIALTIQIN